MTDQNAIGELLAAGLRASSLRGRVIANNIANISTPGYLRKDVRFEALLARALKSKDIDIEELGAEIFEPKSTPVNAQGNDVSLDVEVGELLKNSAKYKTYIRLLGKMHRQMELAIGVK